MWIGYLCAVIVCTIFGLALYASKKEIEQLEAERDSLLGQTARLLEEIERLKEELEKYADVEIKVALTRPEKFIILNALGYPPFKARIREPQTKRFIRIIYNTLIKKIKDSIKE